LWAALISGGTKPEPVAAARGIRHGHVLRPRSPSADASARLVPVRGGCSVRSGGQPPPACRPPWCRASARTAQPHRWPDAPTCRPPAFQETAGTAACQQVGVVVALQQQAMAAGQAHPAHKRGCGPDRSRCPSVQVTIGAGQLQGSRASCGTVKGFSCNSPKSMASPSRATCSRPSKSGVPMRRDGCPGSSRPACAHAGPGPGAQPIWSAVLVGDEDGVDVVGRQTRRGQPGFKARMPRPQSTSRRVVSQCRCRPPPPWRCRCCRCPGF
jgi:hypothetical protein